MPVADDGRARAIKAGFIDPEQSRIVFFLGNVITTGSQWSPSLDWGRSAAEIFINGRDVGGVHAGEALAIDLLPGQYTVGSGEGPEAQKSPPLAITLAAGQIIYVSKDTMARPLGSGAFVGGLLGGAVGGALAGSLDTKTSDDYQGPMLHLHDDGLARIQERQIIAPSIILR
jgi:hypothetical protein